MGKKRQENPSYERNIAMAKKMFYGMEFSEFEWAHVAKMAEPIIDAYYDLGCDEDEEEDWWKDDDEEEEWDGEEEEEEE